jgi:hypothetical protein
LRAELPFSCQVSISYHQLLRKQQTFAGLAPSICLDVHPLVSGRSSLHAYIHVGIGGVCTVSKASYLIRTGRCGVISNLNSATDVQQGLWSSVANADLSSTEDANALGIVGREGHESVFPQPKLRGPVSANYKVHTICGIGSGISIC